METWASSEGGNTQEGEDARREEILRGRRYWEGENDTHSFGSGREA